MFSDKIVFKMNLTIVVKGMNIKNNMKLLWKETASGNQRADNPKSVK